MMLTSAVTHDEGRVLARLRAGMNHYASRAAQAVLDFAPQGRSR
jgi:hypothetical protein